MIIVTLPGLLVSVGLPLWLPPYTPLDACLPRVDLSWTGTCHSFIPSCTQVAEGRTFPNISRIRDVSHAVACAVIEEAQAESLTTKLPAQLTAEQISLLVASKMYYPQYVPLVPRPDA